MKTIIEQQITQNVSTIKIDQLAFICNLVKNKGMQDCNPISIPMKASNFIEMQEENNYKEVNFKIY